MYQNVKTIVSTFKMVKTITLTIINLNYYFNYYFKSRLAKTVALTMEIIKTNN